MTDTQQLPSSPAAEDRLSGYCKWFDPNRKYGFICYNDSEGVEQTVFVHQSDIVMTNFRSLADNAPVEFRILEEEANGRNQRKAIEVTGPGGEPPQRSRRYRFQRGQGSNEGSVPEGQEQRPKRSRGRGRGRGGRGRGQPLNPGEVRPFSEPVPKAELNPNHSSASFDYQIGQTSQAQ